MKRYIALSCLLFLILPLYAINVEVEYVDGYLDVKDGSRWLELAAGDSVTDQDTLRLEENSLATLKYPGGKLTLTRSGIYPISNLIRSKSTSKGVGFLVSNKLKRLVAEPERTRSAVGGVRGAKQDDEIEWMSSEAEELITTGKKFLAEDAIEQALELFIEAYDYAEIEEEPEILYYTAYAHYIMGNTLEAMRNVDDIEISDDAYFAPDYYLLKGQILMDSFAFNEAAEWLETVPDELTDSDTAIYQAVNLLLANCMVSLGDDKSAASYYNEVIRADPGSPFARAAKDAL